MNDANNLAAQHIEAWTAQDVDGVASLYTDDGVYEDVAAQRQARGRSVIRAFMEEAFKAVPDFSVQLETVVLSDTSIACEWIMSGTPAATLDDINATGKSFSVRGASVADIEAGKIKRWSDYYDRQLLLTQLSD